jgi:type IV secretory pathway VirB2 component (pilin)
MGSVTTGWGNDEAKNALRRTMRGGPSGRVAVFVITAACLALGIYGRSLVLSVIAGIATAAAALALVRAISGDRAARRMERRYRTSPDRGRDSAR